MPARGIQVRLFFTAWIVLALHFATDFSREHFLVLSIVEDHSFRLDRYLGLHDDIFETPHRGAHHNANPGASMIAAVPYWLFQPLVHAIDARITASRPPIQEPPEYNDPRPARVRFYQVVREKGWDIRFGLACFISAVFCMAPLTAFSTIIIFRILCLFEYPVKAALLMSLLYTFGTPVFFRSGYLNQNLMVGLFGLFAFYLIRFDANSRHPGLRSATAGLLAGTALLCDYSGLLVLATLGVYAAIRAGHTEHPNSVSPAQTTALRFAAGALLPVCLLWFYQWSCFGNPFLPPQHSMAAANPMAGIGYQGFSLPDPQLLWMLLADARVGLFVVAPMLALGLLAPLVARPRPSGPALPEILLFLCLFVLFVLFFSCVQYTRIQWITGIRYLSAVIPFLFLLTAAVLIRLPVPVAVVLSAFMVIPSWCLAMVRSQAGVWDSVRQVIQGGPQLPWLTTISRLGPQSAPFLADGTQVLLLFAACALVIFAIWRIR